MRINMDMQNDNPITELAKFFKNIDYDKIINNSEALLDFIKQQSLKGSRNTARMMLELYYVLISAETSKYNKLMIGSALAYQLLPNDLLPKEKYGVVGYLDNATALYLAYRKVKKSLTPEIKEKVNQTIDSWSKAAKEFTILKPEEERV
jgi:uncharacterized membrane protein YkvA (DUF1232 family)